MISLPVFFLFSLAAQYFLRKLFALSDFTILLRQADGTYLWYPTKTKRIKEMVDFFKSFFHSVTDTLVKAKSFGKGFKDVKYFV